MRKIKNSLFYLTIGSLCLLFVVSFLFTNLIGNINQINAEEFTIITTFTILEDFVSEITGEKDDVRVICPPGAEIHEWELIPSNFVDLEQADIVFYNGLNVEQWMEQVKAVAGSEVPVIAVGEKCNYPTQPIITGDYAGEPDPHIWMDVKGAISYVKTIKEYLIKHNPDNSEIYQKNTSQYIDELKNLETKLIEIMAEIPDKNRVLITTEAAFIYFADAFDFYHNGIWGTNTEEEGTPGQMKKIIDTINKKEPKAIFWESTGSDRYVKSISEETNIPVFGPLYVDSVRKEGTGAENYINLMKFNADLLSEALNSGQD